MKFKELANAILSQDVAFLNSDAFATNVHKYVQDNTTSAVGGIDTQLGIIVEFQDGGAAAPGFIELPGSNGPILVQRDHVSHLEVIDAPSEKVPDGLTRVVTTSGNAFNVKQDIHAVADAVKAVAHKL